MQITEEFLALGLEDGVLNKTQLSLLEKGKELSTGDINLFLLLKGKFTLSVQKQIVKNYQSVANFHKVKKTPKVSEKLQNF
ncbi:MAG: hypothetical protein Q9M36_11830 [Sulfurovum sp.]|nr:hypothetical protein [Sulfurovum sp.]